MTDFLLLLIALLPVFLIVLVFALWIGRRLRQHATTYDPLWYSTDASKTVPLGYYSAQHHRRIAPTPYSTEMEPRG